HDASPLGGMALMYALMSVFHAAPWLKLISSRRTGARQSEPTACLAEGGPTDGRALRECCFRLQARTCSLTSSPARTLARGMSAMRGESTLPRAVADAHLSAGPSRRVDGLCTAQDLALG